MEEIDESDPAGLSNEESGAGACTARGDGGRPGNCGGAISGDEASGSTI